MNKCIKCGHQWKPHKIGVSKICPGCRTTYWYKEKSHKEKSESCPQSLEYRSWSGMIQRCSNPKNTMYSYYGELGIQVCDSWRTSYNNFLNDMGRRPTTKHTLDRIDSTKNYCPDNCKWSTREEQARNRRSVLLSKTKANEIRELYRLGGTQKEIAAKYGVNKDVIHKVVKNKTWKDI